ncbi:hypothetical protein L7F22_040656 [Adiantum nelumboides]|nr:hypothetical protein [Adiantum nelumboides]
MAQHPFVPETLELPGYVPNFLSIVHILWGYGLASLGVVIAVWFLSDKFRHLIGVERLLMCWWAFTGLAHFILEGYFVFIPDFYKTTTPIFLAKVWKEYSKGHSRYAARDSAVVVVEGITSVFFGG